MRNLLNGVRTILAVTLLVTGLTMGQATYASEPSAPATDKASEHQSGMIKVIVLLHRKQGLTLKEFHDYWSTTHAALFDNNPVAEKYIKGYMQSTPLGALYSEGGAPYDGVAEIYFESEASLREFLQSDYYQRVVRPDELKFIDRSRIVEILTHETVFVR